MAQGGPRRDESKEHFWQDAISGQPGSGLSIRAYCRRHRLQEARFYFWRRELSRRGVSAEPGPAFVPVRIATEQSVTAGQGHGSPCGCIEIVLDGGRQVRLHGPVDRRILADVLAMLAGESDLAAEGRRC